MNPIRLPRNLRDLSNPEKVSGLKRASELLNALQNLKLSITSGGQVSQSTVQFSGMGALLIGNVNLNTSQYIQLPYGVEWGGNLPYSDRVTAEAELDSSEADCRAWFLPLSSGASFNYRTATASSNRLTVSSQVTDTLSGSMSSFFYCGAVIGGGNATVAFTLGITGPSPDPSDEVFIEIEVYKSDGAFIFSDSMDFLGVQSGSGEFTVPIAVGGKYYFVVRPDFVSGISFTPLVGTQSISITSQRLVGCKVEAVYVGGVIRC
jgi:hypothetical protein